MSYDHTCKLALASVDGIGRWRYTRLLREFGTAEAALSANITALLTVSRISFALAKRIIEARHRLDNIARRWQTLRDMGSVARFCDEDDYPTPLKTVNNAPPLLITVGSHQDFPDNAVAIVGTRSPAPETRAAARAAAHLAREAGATVVSGLARGIDTEAHRAAIDAHDAAPSPATIAVLGCALDSLYPHENESLAEDIRKRGAIATERLSGETRPAWLVQRNRIISGLSARVLVVEFHEQKDGSLHTARFALDQGRDVAIWNRWKAADQQAVTQLLAKRGVPSFELISDEPQLLQWLDRPANQGHGFSPPSLLFDPGPSAEQQDQIWPIIWSLDPVEGNVTCLAH